MPTLNASALALRLLIARVVLVACGLAMAGCASSTGLWVEIGEERFTVELADDDAKRTRGLMFRDVLEPGHGMLFLHERERSLAYWMKNTRIALDILYFDRSLRLVSQQRDVPPCSLGDRCPVYPSDAPAQFVLELNAGEAARLDLRNGEQLRLSPAIELPPTRD